MERIFKVGDKVFHIQYGWGIIKDEVSNMWIVVFESRARRDDEVGISVFGTKLLSFTEYTLQGFSQERPEELPKVGQVVWTRNEFPSEWEIGYFLKKEGNTYYTSASKNSQGWRSAGLEIRTTNPYEEQNND